MQPDSKLCPRDVVLSFRFYIDEGIPPGGFLTSVLENDLREAIGHADSQNLEALEHIVAWLYHNAPTLCWGSPKRVHEWLSGGCDEFNRAMKPLPHLKPITTKLAPAPKDHERFQDSQGD